LNSAEIDWSSPIVWTVTKYEPCAPGATVNVPETTLSNGPFVIVIFASENRPSGEEEIVGSCSLLPKPVPKNETTVPGEPHPGLNVSSVTPSENVLGAEDNASTTARDRNREKPEGAHELDLTSQVIF